MSGRWKAKCDSCGKVFWSDEAVKILYSEHPGAPRTAEEEVCPFCGGDFSDV